MPGKIGNIGSVGRPRKSNEEKRKLGTYRHHRDVEQEVPVLPFDESPPVFLDEHGRKVWEETLPLLKEMRVISKSDLGMLGRYCALQGAFIALCVLKTPLHGREMATMNGQIQGLEDRLGLNPLSRSRVRATPPKNEEKENKLVRFIRGGPSKAIEGES